MPIVTLKIAALCQVFSPDFVQAPPYSLQQHLTLEFVAQFVVVSLRPSPYPAHLQYHRRTLLIYRILLSQPFDRPQHRPSAFQSPLQRSRTMLCELEIQGKRARTV